MPVLHNQAENKQARMIGYIWMIILLFYSYSELKRYLLSQAFYYLKYYDCLIIWFELSIKQYIIGTKKILPSLILNIN